MARMKNRSRRGPLSRLHAFMNGCSVKSAFVAYALAAFAAAFALSCIVLVAASNAYSDANAERYRHSGIYIYDARENALIPAERLPWDVRGAAADGEEAGASDGRASAVSVYVERLDADERYFSAIDLDADPSDLSALVLQDLDFQAGPDESHEPGAGAQAGEPSVDELAAYDARANAERGDVEALRASLPADSAGERPLVSFAGYYVYSETVPWVEAIPWAAAIASIVLCALCLAAAARRFYRRKLRRPVEAMDDAARRIAAGDLDFSLHVDEGGELGRLCATFETMRAELEREKRAAWRAAESRRRADAAFAHDLRTPLTVLSGRIEMLEVLAGRDALSGEAACEMAVAMRRQVERLAAHAQGVRDLDALELFKPALAPARLGAWFDQAADDARELAAARGIRLCADARGLDTVVALDAGATTRVVDDLAANAVRHARSEVRMSCLWEDGVLRVEVSDDGPGFSRAALAHACEPYWREEACASDAPEPRDEPDAPGLCDAPDTADRARRDETSDDSSCRVSRSEAGHFGLGLNICSILCEKMGGSLALENAPGAGARVIACVSAQAARCECAAPHAKAPGPSAF